MADKRISQLVERTDIANNDVLPIVASGATTTNKVTISTIQDWMQDNLDVGVTSVGLTLGTTGTDVNVTGSPITTSGNITINIPTASATNRGLLSSADWTTFNNKQASGNYVTIDTNQSITGIKTFTNSILLKNSPSLAGFILQSFSPNALEFGATISGTTYYSSITFPAGSQNWNLPNASGTLALTSQLGAYLPLAGGTLTGALNGVNASFTSTISSQDRIETETIFSVKHNSTIFTVNGYNSIQGNLNSFAVYNGTKGMRINFPSNESFTHTLPDASGTLALTSDIPSLAGYVTLGTAQTITAQKTFSTSGSSDTAIINHSSGSGIALNISKGGNGEGLRVAKTSGSGNAVTITGGLLSAEAATLTGALNGTSATFSGVINGQQGVFRNSGVPGIQVIRDLNVVSVGSAGQGIEFGALNGTTPTAGAAIYGGLDNPATTGNLVFQTLTGGTLTTKLTLASTGAATFSSSVTATEIRATTYVDSTNQVIANNTITTPTNDTTLSNGTVYALNGISTTNNYGIGVSGIRNGNYDIWFQTGSTNGGGYRFYKGTSELMTIATSGNVGIGTASPSNKLSVFETGASGIAIADISGGSSGAAVLQLSAGKVLSTTSFDLIQNSAGAFINQRDNNPLAFFVNGGERMRITSGGNVGINNNNPTSKLHILNGADGFTARFTGGASNNIICGIYSHSTTGGGFASIGVQSGHGFNLFTSDLDRLAVTAGGQIFMYALATGAGTNALRYSTATGQVTYDTSSARYKDNIRESTYGLNDVMQLKSSMFEYKEDGRTDIGLIAEEVYDVIPELVALDKDGEPDAVSYDRFISVLIKAIQELKTEIDSLKNQIK